MSSLAKLKSCSSRSDLAKLLEIELKHFTYLLYGLSDSEKYFEFSIPKKTGGLREIVAPIDELKDLQKKLSNILQECLSEIEAKSSRKSPSHGFKKERSIITNAKSHTRKRYVINIDLENFFHTFNFGRVRGFFLTNKHFELNEEVSTSIAQIACYKRHLPQGAPSSPVITNLICNILDVRLSNLAKKNKCKYSRYADDITFSSRSKVISKELVRQENHKWSVSGKLKKEIKRADFIVNDKKTRVQYKNSKQDVTGLVVNEKISIPSKYWRTVRAMVDNLLYCGHFTITKRVLEEEELKEVKIEGKIEQLNGMLSYIDSVDLHNAKKGSVQVDLNQRERTYRDFLYFNKFYANNKPTIICEGKTDHVYLRCALKKQYQDHNILIEKSGDDLVSKVSFYKYTELETRLLGVTGGSSLLKAFIANYPKVIRKFSVPASNNPVIILIDNDKGAKEIFSQIKTITDSRSTIDGSELFYKLYDNFYVIATPAEKGKMSMIENFFPKSLLKTELGGKTLELDEKKFDKSKHYGKAYFADRVIAPNYKKIDCSEFSKIFYRIEAAIRDSRR